MRQHHTKVHGESLPNRTCKGCERDFYDPKADRIFCDDCNPNAGKHNGNWKDAKETAYCKLCEAGFEYYPSDKEGVYCPQCVEESEEFLGEQYGLDAPRITRNCDNCGNEMSVLLSDWERGEGRFCDFDCLCSWMSIDGRAKRTDYGRNWKPVKAQALERDNNTCQHCGVTAETLGHEPDVHHVIPVREFDDPGEAHTLDNVVCLCRACHRRVEVGKLPVPTLKDVE